MRNTPLCNVCCWRLPCRIRLIHIRSVHSLICSDKSTDVSSLTCVMWLIPCQSPRTSASVPLDCIAHFFMSLCFLEQSLLCWWNSSHKGSVRSIQGYETCENDCRSQNVKSSVHRRAEKIFVLWMNTGLAGCSAGMRECIAAPTSAIQGTRRAGSV